ncbi:hypothetical protein ACJ41O_015362 [Fusarium nematophilum]
MDPAYDASPETELPSCSGCRKRKLKCSRQKPACSNCDRLRRAEERQEETSHVPRNRKRKRHEGRDRLDQGHQVGPSRESDIAYEVLDELLDAYFSHVQPWIPMIRESSFRQRLQQGEDQGVSVILQAMAVAALRFVGSGGIQERTNDETVRLRRLVLLTAMDGLSLENLQALIIIAFTDALNCTDGIQVSQLQTSVADYPSAAGNGTKTNPRWISASWKMYLPQHWKDSGVSRETMPGVMDPNMTVANATHNISLILLHERIAYPDAELNGVRLPSLCSADTCYSAATETANITTKYLEGPSRLPVSPHLGICAFVSGRVLLVHWRYYGGKLADEFQVLVENLGEMSRRWAGCQAQQPNQQQQACLFSQLADRLNNLYRESSQESGHASLEPFGIPTESRPPPQSTANTQMYQENPRIPTLNLTSQLPGLNHMDQITEPGSDERNPKVPQSNTRDELSAISQILMDNDFLEMDRIISFEDMMSAGDLSHAML